MKRQALPQMLIASPWLMISNLVMISSLVGCGAPSELQAPVAASAAPEAFHYNPTDLRPPLTFVDGEKSVYRSLPAAQNSDAREAVSTGQVGEVVASDAAITLAPGATSSVGLAPSALALAAGLYVEGQSLERTHAFPQAVAAYDRLLELEDDYADARARRATLLELVRLADDFYVRAMDADSDEERLLYLRQVDQFWPEYRDVDTQLQQLRRAAALELIELSKAAKARAKLAKAKAKAQETSENK